jgi:hypothetical protein
MALRAGLGFVGMIYCWNYASFRHCSLFLIIVYIVGFGWDLPSVANEIWVYIKAGQPAPKIYDGLTFKILSAEFPIELFGYYFTGGFFSFWTISFFKKYFEGQHKQNFELYTKVERRDISDNIKKLEPDKRIINLGKEKKSKYHSPFDDIKDVPHKRIRNADDIRRSHEAREAWLKINPNIKEMTPDKPITQLVPDKTLVERAKEWDAKEKAVKKEVKGSDSKLMSHKKETEEDREG